MYQQSTYELFDNLFYENIRKMAQTLRRSRTKQVYKKLAKFNMHNNTPLGKCALGILSCKYGQRITKNNVSEIYTVEILESCGITHDWGTNFISANLTDFNYTDVDIGFLIEYLNDSLKLKFNEIADYLETTFIPEGMIEK